MSPQSEPTAAPPELEALHPIVLPEPVSWMPATPAWIVLAIVAVGLAFLGARALVRRHAAARYRREALAELDRLRAADDEEALRQLPALVKRTLLATCPRPTVASLSGASWLAFLDRTYRGRAFSEGPGRLLPRLAYEADVDLGAEDRRRLFSLLQRWIRKHRAPV